MQSREQIHAMVRDALAELFELDPARITLDAQLNDDLEIDSIDAVDLIDRLKKATGKKMSAEDFRTVRTVQDLVLAIERLQDS
ncbi:MAG TPA: acyl carrier protein [Steroidobacteraceae bacterium]|nr:acyl carrier protein [Steroidobacteraceae bacterium]